MAFRQRPIRPAPPEDPVQLYRNLGPRGGAPRALWIHQGDVLREWYANHRDRSDVAIELPTGAGKTLVGALVGEWRRRVNEERVAYLCPTRQLAQQTHSNLESYGFPTVLLTGKSRDWSAAERHKYSSGEALAVTTYSHVFNCNPAIGDADVLVLDDAHAADSFVADPWTIVVGRNETAYFELLEVLRSAFDVLVLNRLQSTSPDGNFLNAVYLATPSGVSDASQALESVLASAVTTGAVSPGTTYKLRLMAGHLARCLVYASYKSICIRPYIPPTASHSAFDACSLRLYMSATLGSGGELERSFGRRSIARIPVPVGWDRQGTGRRFFCFPELTTDLHPEDGSLDTWVGDLVDDCRKAVVLAPDDRVRKLFSERRINVGMPQFMPEDIESDNDVFTTAARGALLLANRYDGIDLPDGACRLVVLQGLPGGGDLQERFLRTSLGAIEVLQERIRARVVQGAGRATRNAGDFAVVLMLGSELSTFVARRDVQDALHPEVHAELSFGLNNSIGMPSAEMSANIKTFLAQGDDWHDIEPEIVAERDEFDRVDPPGSAELGRSAGYEVSAWLAAWQGEWHLALENAKSAIDALRGGRAPQRYAALWNYLASGWAMRVARVGTGDADESARRYYQAARAAGRGTTWLANLAAPAEPVRTGREEQRDMLDVDSCATIASSVDTIFRGSGFEAEMAVIREGLVSKESRPFEQSLVKLGSLVGASQTIGNEGASAAPDATWEFGDHLWACFEAKNEALETGQLGAGDVRQAGGHLRYHEARVARSSPSGSVAILVTPQEVVHPSATMVAEPHVFRCLPSDIVTGFDRVVGALRKCRSFVGSLGPDEVFRIFTDERCLPSVLIREWTAQPITSA